jgi:hypothetical protein
MLHKMLLGLAIFGLAVASAKSYAITLNEPYTVGSQTLQPGGYHVVVNGTTATLADSRKQVQISGKTENEARKFDQTAVVSSREGNTTELKAIQLGGTHFEIDFD